MDVLLFVIAGVILGGITTIIESLKLNTLPMIFAIASSIVLLLFVFSVLGKLLAVEIEDLSYLLLFSFFISFFATRMIIYEIFLSGSGNTENDNI